MMLAGFSSLDALPLARVEGGVADHLWQSTVVAAALGASTLFFRRNSAGVRFALWLAASLKFLIPFAWLMSAGNWMASLRTVPQTGGAVYTVVEQVSEPFTRSGLAAARPANALAHLLAILPPILAMVWFLGTATVLTFWWVRWRRLRAAMRRAVLMEDGREVALLRRLEPLAGVSRPVGLRLSQESMEPGVFGIVRPVLVWPAGISGHLDDAQMTAILAHELWHVRRRDNLAAILHMVVEAIFWFHPLVWWIGARLVEERERACDEEVVRLGHAAEVYAESILNACKFCVEVPLSCVSGVAGSNLKRRIVQIMHGKTVDKLTTGRKVGLAAMATLALVGPVVFGVLHAPQLQAQISSSATPVAGGRQAFDSVSIKPSQSSEKHDQMNVQPGQFIDTNVTVKKLIAFAYSVDEYQLSGAPEWMGTERYDVEAAWHPAAKGAGMAVPLAPAPQAGAPAMSVTELRPGALQARLRTMLAERFGLKLRREQQDMPIYELVVAGKGTKLTPTPAAPTPPSFNGEPIVRARVMFKQGAGELSLSNGPVAAFAGLLSMRVERKVVDKTGLTGNYDVSLHWTAGDDEKESMTSALQEQLGLKLEDQHGLVPVLVIDQVEKPTED